MMMAIFLIVAGGLLLYYGGDWLVDGAAGLSLRWGLSPLVVGLTVVAFGTSAPELAVCIKAGLDGVHDIALGNVIGSNICNIGLVLAIAALIKPLTVKSQLVKIDAPIAIISAVVFCFMLWDKEISRFDGVLLFAGVLAYVIFSLKMSKQETSEVEHEFEDEIEDEHKSLTVLFGLVLLGLAAVTFGGKIFVEGASEIATQMGVSQAVIGLTIVALGTSLPELATSILASLKGHGDMALGNVIGSCIFNLLAIIGLSSIITPLQAGAIDVVDLGVMLGVMVLLWPLLRSKLKLSRIEGGILLSIYIGYSIWLFSNSSGVQI